ncbi:MAG: nuclear transport factor 2 family protein [Candidatus Sulfotelmatobacter sp.]
MWKLFAVFLVLGSQLAGQARTDGDRNRILSLENAWNQAVYRKDTTALKMLLSADLVYVDFDGKLMDSAAYLASVRSQAIRPERIVSEFMDVHLYGAVAVVNGMYRENGTKSGKPYTLRERFTDTWVRQNGSWVCVASQSTLASQ